jgi:alkylhydroperoxidase/carboxymuconolactone decarboxylase family protein YurZ
MSDSPAIESPIGATVMAMTAAAFAHSSLPDREMMLARIAAMAAMGAPALSYTINVGAAVESGITLEDAKGLLVAIAPVIGTARTAQATVAISEALGIELAV